jgi:hypothetical protein
MTATTTVSDYDDDDDDDDEGDDVNFPEIRSSVSAAYPMHRQGSAASLPMCFLQRFASCVTVPYR